MSFTIIWFRDNLRLIDNAPVYHALISGSPVLSLFIYDEIKSLGAAQNWWLHQSLLSFKKDLAEKGIPFILKKGKPFAIFQELRQKLGNFSLHTNISYDPQEVSLLKSLETHLNISIYIWDSKLLFPPTLFKKNKPEGYKVFSPFWKACLSQGIENRPLYILPEKENPQTFNYNCLSTETIESLNLVPAPHNWTKKFKPIWKASEAEALNRFHSFLDKSLIGYSSNRNLPGKNFTSLLSPYLRFGQISPFYIWKHVKHSQAPHEDKKAFLTEIGWREFAYHLLYHHPTMPKESLRSEFASFPWEESPLFFKAWKEGNTGYPIVDAGMRQLWQTGWMHNRVRMIVSSFLVKDLLIPWQAGERWFWETLLDADLAVNAMNWQWVAGSGIDAAPYFRIFNPILQGEKFDPEGDYIRRFVPELNDLPSEYIHKPFMAPPSLLEKHDVILGNTYPMPIVDHAQARKKALMAYKVLKNFSS